MDISVDAKIDGLQRELVKKYIYLMLGIQIAFFIMFYSLDQNRNSVIMYFSLIEFAFIFYTYSLVKKNYNIDKVVTAYLVISPLFLVYLILNFYTYSLVLMVWLTPLPFGASIFFSRKKTLFFTVYTAFLILSILMIVYTTDYENMYYDERIIKISDLLHILSNGIVFYLLFYYQNKIKLAKAAGNKETLNEEGDSEKNTTLTFELSDTKLKDIFNQIEELITTKEPYKESDFTIAQLSTELKINSKYLSGSLKAAGYTNFNHYLNLYRIEYAKKMMVNSDLNKITLLYIYTEAGFSNQSTFNRVFKGFEGITPSEYIKNLS